MTDQEKINSPDYEEILIDFEIPQGVSPFQNDAVVLRVDNDLNIVYLNRRDITREIQEGIIYRSIPKIYGLCPERRENTSGLFDPGPLLKSGIIQVQEDPLNLTGRGVVLGFLDTGIRYEEEVFRNPDGTTRILGIWDQTISSGTPPEGLLYGSEYQREMIDEALTSENPRDIVPSTDENGHGTRMASVSAGSILSEGLSFIGAAPEADIAVVKLREAKPYLKDLYLIPEGVNAYAESDLITAIRYLESFAIALERPLVICIGLATNLGDHTGQSVLSSYLNTIAARRSRTVVISGGSEGNSGHHFVGYAAEGLPETVTNVEMRIEAGVEGFVMELWGSVLSGNSITIRSPGGEMTRRINFRQSSALELSFVYDRTRIEVAHVLVEQGTGEELVFFRFQNPSPGIWTLIVSTTGGKMVEQGNFHLWLPMSEFIDEGTVFLEPSPYVTLTEPSNTREVITTTYFQDSNNSFDGESGRGFTRTGERKPDLCTPGVAVSTVDGSVTGGSMAAALLSGICAQFMQWAVVEENNRWVESRELKNYLIRGAVRSQGTNYPSRTLGMGLTNILRTFDVLAGLLAEQ